MKTIEKIRQKIEELYDGEAPAHAQQCDFDDGYFTGIGAISKFLDTLESEKPINLDDAMKELDEKIALVKQRGTWKGVDVDKYMDEVRGREPEKPMNLEEEVKRYYSENFDYISSDQPTLSILTNIARHFTDWQKEQMMKEAVEGEIQMRYSGCLCAKTIRAINEDKFKLGDKVRIIIVKED